VNVAHRQQNSRLTRIVVAKRTPSVQEPTVAHVICGVYTLSLAREEKLL